MIRIRYLLVIAAMIWSVTGFSQELEMYLGDSAMCSYGILKANADFNAGRYYVGQYGLQMYWEDPAYSTFYRDYLKEKYGIHLELAGCSVEGWEFCHKHQMILLLEQKFGEGVLDNAIDSAEVLFREQYQIPDSIPLYGDFNIEGEIIRWNEE